jgi:tight adherence protein B
VGSVTSGQNIEPEVVPDTRGVGIFNNSLGLWLGVLLALLAAAMAVFAVIMIFVREDTGLSATLSAYTEDRYAETEELTERRSRLPAFLRGPILRQATEAAEEFVQRRGLQPRVEGMLERANLPLRAGEALFFYVGIVILGTLAGLLITQSLVGTVLVFFATVAVPPAVVQLLAGRRRRKVMSQLPDTLQLLSGSLRAGYSLMQGVEAVSQEIDDPMGYELRRIVAESRLGRALEEALQDTADRMGSDDFSWAVMAIRIQREVGGNLAELLDTVAETMIARERLRREVRALTAEGRISAIILGFMPLGMLAILWAINPEYIEVLFDDGLGQFMLIGGALLAGVGFYWLKKIVEIEI